MRFTSSILVVVLASFGHLVQSGEANNQVVREFTVLEHVAACTGEPVLVQGVLMRHGRLTEDASGGQHFRNFTSFHGTGYTADGARYTLVDVGRGTNNSNGATPEEENGPRPEGTAAWVGSATQTIIGIRQGEVVPDDDLKFLAVFHYTETPDGELTAFVDTFEAVCR